MNKKLNKLKPLFKENFIRKSSKVKSKKKVKKD